MPDDVGRSIGSMRMPMTRSDVIRTIAIERPTLPGRPSTTVSPRTLPFMRPGSGGITRGSASEGRPIYLPGNQATTVSPSAPPSTFYGTDNPYLVLSDVFRNIFGSSGDTGRQRDVGQALVPVTSTSGGSNPLVLLLVVAAVVGVAYYFYKKRQNQ